MKRRHLALGAALLVSAALVLFGDGAPDSGVSGPVARKGGAAVPAPAAMRREGGAASAPGAEPAILALAPRARGDDALGAEGAPFGGKDWNPPPPKQEAAPPPPPPPPPSAPPLPFTYVGKAAAEGQWEVFLARADKTYIVRPNMVIDGVYRVDSIAPPILNLTYLPLNQVQQLNIGVLD